jgi:N-acetylneuraminate synthase
MIIEKNLKQFALYEEASVKEAIAKLQESRQRIVVAVSEHGAATGVLTFGDLLRWLAAHPTPDLSRPFREVMNPSFVSVREGAGHSEVKTLLQHYRYLPIVGVANKLRGIVRERRAFEGLRFGDRWIRDGNETFIIAEIGLNHNGDMALATKLVHEAANAGAKAAKFQMRNLASLYANKGESSDPKENLGTQYALEVIERSQLPPEKMFELFDLAKELGMVPLCTPWDVDSLRVLEDYGMEAYKIASADLTNHDLLREVAATGKPMLCSTGMSRESEIIESVRLLSNLGAQFALLHCNATYPAPFRDINLKYMARLKDLAQTEIGYSGHERGYHIPVAAVAMGATIIEKHLTLDKTLPGNDHKISLLPQEFQRMVQLIREVEESLGACDERKLSQGEMMNRVNLAKSLRAGEDISRGETITEAMLEVVSPGRGLQPNRKKDLVGRAARRDMRKGDFFYDTDLDDSSGVDSPWEFKRPWGIPVRYSDYAGLIENRRPDLIEFHLSYKDLDLDFRDFIKSPLDMDFTVHSPDLFSGDHLLNLASTTLAERERSRAELERVIQLTRELQPYFTRSKRPRIIASVGGFTRDRLLSPSERMDLYATLEQELSRMDFSGVELLPQTLPPFPWYFGGQLFLNLFVEPEDTLAFCERTGHRICLDICHTRLAANHFGWALSDFISQLGPHTGHIHLSDARGVDGEGVQIGEGEINFDDLGSRLEKSAPGISFIPEIWQGHENGGRGFWTALSRLSGKL